MSVGLTCKDAAHREKCHVIQWRFSRSARQPLSRRSAQERLPFRFRFRTSSLLVAVVVVVLLGPRVARVDGGASRAVDADADAGPALPSCGIPECTCRSDKAEVKINCSGVTGSNLTKAEAEVRSRSFPTNASTLVVERSDLAAFPWSLFFALHRLRVIQIHHCSVVDSTHILSLASANFTRNITNLNLQWNSIQKVDYQLLSLFPAIEHLYLSSNSITEIEKGSFRVVPRLEHLDVSNNDIGSALLTPGALSGLQQLRELKLENCSIKVIHRHAFRGLTSLKYLHLARNQLSAVPVNSLAEAPQLLFLHLGYNNITFVDNNLSRLNRLQYVYLHSNGLEAIHPRALDGFERLQQIVLNNNRLKYLPAGLEPTLQQMPQPDGISLVNVTWRCDCRLLWLVRLEQTAALKSSVSAPSLPRCFLPRHLTNTSLRVIAFESLRCPKLAGCEEDELSSVQCEWCPPFQRPTHGGVRCMCMEGYEFVPNHSPVCQPCPVGLHKEGVMDGPCEACPANSTTLAEGSATCLCLAGFTLTPRKTCEPCPVNTYKSKAGNYRCLSCPSGSGAEAGSTGIGQCRCLRSHLHVNADLSECVAVVLHKGSTLDATAGVGFDKGTLGGNITAERDKTTGSQMSAARSPISRSGLIAAISGGVVVAAALLLMLVLTLLCAKRLPCRKHADFFVDNPEAGNGMAEVTIETSIMSHTPPDSALRIRRVRVGRLLGRGAFGQVHAGILCVSQLDVKRTFPVAVKRLKDRANDEERKVLQEELEQMILVGPHPNIIHLIGSCVHQGSLHIIMELAEGGDLMTYLRQGKLRHEQYVSVGPDGTLREQKALQVTDHSDLMLFAWHIAKGMSHLENVKCIHRDLAARNCLLTAGPVAKLSDFGLSRDVYENGYYLRHSKGRVPYKWLSPEALLWGQYSNKSDVWSYGVLLWEIATFGGTPYSGVPPDRIAHMHRTRYLLPQPLACPDRLYRVMRSCWHEDPRKRPTFRTLCDVMEIFVQAAADTKYLDLQQGNTLSPLSLNEVATTPMSLAAEGEPLLCINNINNSSSSSSGSGSSGSGFSHYDILRRHLLPSSGPSATSSRLSIAKPRRQARSAHHPHHHQHQHHRNNHQAQLNYLTLAGCLDDEEEEDGEGEEMGLDGEAGNDNTIDNDDDADVLVVVGGQEAEERLELKPVLIMSSLLMDEDGGDTEWKRQGRSSAPDALHGGGWNEGKNDFSQEHNYTSGYSSSLSLSLQA